MGPAASTLPQHCLQMLQVTASQQPGWVVVAVTAHPMEVQHSCTFLSK